MFSCAAAHSFFHSAIIEPDISQPRSKVVLDLVLI
jgi:hypothetical protein